MAKLAIEPGSTSQTVYVIAADTASTTGAGKTAVAYNASGLTAYYVLVRGAATAITLAAQTPTGAYSSGGWAEVDATHCPGLYRLDLPDAVVAVGSRSAVVYIQGAPGMAPIVLEVDLSNDANAVRLKGTALTARDIGASVLLSSGTGTGQVSLTAGAVTAGAVSDKTGYALAPSGLNAVDAAAPSGVAATFPQMLVQVWRRFFVKTTATAGQLKTYADDGSTVVTTQAVTDDGTTVTVGAAS